MNNRNSCYGCGVCSYVCKTGAITMTTDAEGFLYPSVNKDKCILCGRCDGICPSNNGNIPLATYGGHLQDKQVLSKCASGGAFTALASSFIKLGGVVFAASDDPSKQPQFMKLTKIDDIYQVQGSKYFQINLSQEIYAEIEKSLKQSKVLFCGTPCQVSAVKKVFERLSNNLYTIDLICGGTPSYKLVRQFRNYKEKLYGKKIIEHRFRAKDDSTIHGYQSRLVLEDGTVIHSVGMKDEYTRLFASGITLRKSCYQCEFSGESRVGDISVGDYWGISSKSELYNERGCGVSLFICNTQRGKDMLTQTENIKIENADFNIVKQNNRPLRTMASPRIERKIALKIMNVLPFKIAVNIVCYRYLIKRILNIEK